VAVVHGQSRQGPRQERLVPCWSTLEPGFPSSESVTSVHARPAEPGKRVSHAPGVLAEGWMCVDVRRDDVRPLDLVHCDFAASHAPLVELVDEIRTAPRRRARVARRSETPIAVHTAAGVVLASRSRGRRARIALCSTASARRCRTAGLNRWMTRTVATKRRRSSVEQRAGALGIEGVDSTADLGSERWHSGLAARAERLASSK